jgi:hypothetical protein
MKGTSESHRIPRHAHVENPDRAQAEAAIGEVRLVRHDQEIAVEYAMVAALEREEQQ